MVPSNGTARKVELSWEDMMAGHFPAPVVPVPLPPAPVQVFDHSWDEAPDAPEPLARQLFRSAVTQVAIRAVETMPGANGRVAAAVKLVLSGDVSLRGDGTADIGSQSDGETVYHVSATCPCPDAVHRATDGQFCKHRIALAMHRRATDMVRQRLDAPPAPVDENRPADPLVPPSAALPLPEAPASVNCYVTLAGRQVQVTLRDTDEGRLLTRLEVLLARFPLPQASAQGPDPVVTPVPPQAPPEGWCALHGVQMRQGQNERGSWWSHNVDGVWCKGR